MLFLTGCNVVEYRHDTYTVVNGKPVLTESNITKYGSACVNIKTGMVMANVNDEFSLIILKRELLADPNSAKAIGEAITSVMTGGMSEIIK